MRFMLRATACLVVSGVLAACGTEIGEPIAASGDWRVQRLEGEPSVDFATVLATAGDDAVVLMISDDGVLQPHYSRDGAAFEPAEPVTLGMKYVGLGGAVRLPGGSWASLGSGGLEQVDGDDELTFEPLGLRSDDGITWSQVAVTGFNGPVEFNDMMVVDGVMVVAGSYRTGQDPSMGGFRAALWTSTDGQDFVEVPLPGSGSGESYAAHLAVSGERLLAAGRTGRNAALWSSEDAGQTWQLSEDAAVLDAYALSGLAVQGQTVVATPAGDAANLLRSADGGVTWEVLSAPAGGGEGYAPLWAAAGHFFTVSGGSAEPFPPPEVCYADLSQCGERPEAGVFWSADGVGWSRLDTAGLGEVDHFVGTADGRLLMLTGEGEGRAVNTLAAHHELPSRADPAAPPTVELVTLRGGVPAEPGLRYHHPFYVHCGMDWLWFGDRTWRRTDDGPDLETGAGDDPIEGWPLVGQVIYGFATLVGDGTVEYSLEDGEVIATYERADGAPGCD